MPRYYVEHDGRLLARRDSQGTYQLPEQVDVAFDERARRTLRGTEVVFGEADVDEHPEEWPRKDDLAHDPDASALVHAAINASLFRPVVGVVVQDEGRILLVKPARGVAQGRWTLPGGFVGAFEAPREAARREVREETGLELEALELAATVTYRHSGAPYPILGLGFTAQAASRELTLPEDEIEEAAWQTPDKARQGAGGVAQAVLDELEELA